MWQAVSPFMRSALAPAREPGEFAGRFQIRWLNLSSHDGRQRPHPVFVKEARLTPPVIGV
jgi:hypothetical protein